MPAKARPSSAAIRAARELIGSWYQMVPGVQALEAVQRVARALREHRQPPSVLLAAMSSIDEARDELDVIEYELTEALRAAGVPWHTIGEAQGFHTAKQGAVGRFRRLRQHLNPTREAPPV